MSDSNGPSSFIVVLLVGMLVLLGAGAFLLTARSSSGTVATALVLSDSAFSGFRVDHHPNGALASCEVSLSERGALVVRRARWQADGALDAATSGLFRDGQRMRALSAIEVEDLQRVSTLDPSQVESELPSSLLAKD